jgi:hypothetical protein
MISDILSHYKKLNEIFNNHLNIDVIHNDVDLVFRSSHREILKSIMILHTKEYNIDCFLKEHLFGKCLIIPDIQKNFKPVLFNNIKIYYKEAFIHRMNIIFESLTNKVYPLIKEEFDNLIKLSEIDLDLYFKYREKIENIRNN